VSVLPIYFLGDGGVVIGMLRDSHGNVAKPLKGLDLLIQAELLTGRLLLAMAWRLLRALLLGWGCVLCTDAHSLRRAPQ
jgi:hypothetical protein